MFQFSARKPPCGVIFDSDFASTPDTVLALALLHGFEGKNQARVSAITISNSSLEAAQFCDVVEKFYLSATTGAAAMFIQGLPVGLADGRKASAAYPMVTGVLGRKNDAGEPVYTPRVHTINDTAEPEVLMRNALTAQYNGNAAIASAGPVTNLAKLLKLTGARDLIASKAKFLALSMGTFPTGDPDPNVAADFPALERVLAEWPTPIFFCGREIGHTLLYPAASIQSDYAYAPAHPVADAYRAYKTMPYDAPTDAMTAVLYAVKPDGGFFKTSDPGTVTFGTDGRAKFAAGANGKHRYLVLDPAQKDSVLKLYTELASAKPVPRVRRPLQDDKKADEPEQKKEAAPNG